LTLEPEVIATHGTDEMFKASTFVLETAGKQLHAVELTLSLIDRGTLSKLVREVDSKLSIWDEGATAVLIGLTLATVVRTTSLPEGKVYGARMEAFDATTFWLLLSLTQSPMLSTSNP
jgi:hypothetical protein